MFLYPTSSVPAPYALLEGSNIPFQSSRPLSPGESGTIEITNATSQQYYCLISDADIPFGVTPNIGNFVGTPGWTGTTSIAAGDSFVQSGALWQNIVSFEVTDENANLGWISMHEIVD